MALLVVPPIPGMFWSPATVVFLISAFGVGVIGSILFLAGFVGVIRAELKYGK